MKPNRGGVTLLELIIGIAMLVALIVFAMIAFRRFAVWQAEDNRTHQLESELRSLSFSLQAFLEGSRSFQSPSFRVPGTALECRGAGFCVDADKDFDGNPSAGNDLLYALVRVPSSVDLKLSSSFSGGTKLPLATVSGTGNVSDLPLRIGDFLVVSNLRTAELLRVAVAPDPGPSILLDLPASGPSTAFTATTLRAGVPTIEGTYVSGDPVYKARFVKLGYHPASKEVRSLDLGAGETHSVAHGLNRFQISYSMPSVTSGPAACAVLQTPADGYARVVSGTNRWSVINSAQCYPLIASVQVDLETGDTSGVGTLKRSALRFRTGN